jgi:hypothetical protein
MHADAMPAVRALANRGMVEEGKRKKEADIDLLGSIVETV